MSPKQKAWYWREWGAAVKAAQAAGLDAPDRHALHRRALGVDKSSKSFTNADLDRVIAEFRAYSDPDHLRPQLRQIHQPRSRMLHLIRHDKLRELAIVLDNSSLSTPNSKLDRARQYIGKIIQTKYHSVDLDDLTDAQLTLLIVDLTRATTKRRKAAGLTWPELRAAAGTRAHHENPLEYDPAYDPEPDPDDVPF